MKLYNKHNQQQHEDRLEALRQQHEEQIQMVENQKPQPIEFEQAPADGEPLDIGNGVLVLPGDYYNRDLGIAVSQHDTAWVKADQ